MNVIFKGQAAFNQDKALVGAFSIIVKSMGTFGYPSFEALVETETPLQCGDTETVTATRGISGPPAH